MLSLIAFVCTGQLQDMGALNWPGVKAARVSNLPFIRA